MAPHPELRLVRSLLFLPASNPRAVEKARGLAADMVVLDLEDAVKAQDKARARAAAVAAAAEGFAGLCAIRVNSHEALWQADVEAVRGSRADFVIYPRTAGPDDVARTGAATGKPALAMVETARGVLNAAAIAPSSVGLIAGTNDLAADLGLRPGGPRAPLLTALQTILLAARAAGVAAFDGVFNRLEDGEGLEAECREGRSFGFDGKSLIHPNQIEAANRLFAPSEEELAAARRLVAAATGGAERHEGEMIERMHVEQARLMLARAGKGAG
ncbi:MAG: CoA ester lyase [Alphaproteobacteria bacterium]|nr:CoA ester lyase [Alphaproteobacteria bacterium]MBV9372450.1 CoA ester lyase [Alphaproteobacteria bacterium]MBV9902125.1 CoA ester lyase [Alphaproteobacteria bacterium]